MPDQLISRREMDFLLHDWIGIEDPGHRELAGSFLDLSERLAEDRFLTHYKTADVAEPRLHEGRVTVCPDIATALREYAELGLFASGFPENLGGFDLPYLLCSASFAYFAAANIATAAYPMLTVANARLISTFGSSAQIETFVRRQVAGEWFGTMCLSEPQAGSSLADIRTRALEDGEDDHGKRYRITGTKQWISGGDQNVSGNIVHLVLAKIPAADGTLPSGTGGISLFIVPRQLPDGQDNDISVAGLNHKMGYRGTANCLLNFGENGGATGWLVGQPGQGLRQMFMMMNEARIGVGTGAAALAHRGYRLSLRYASERSQGRLAQHRDGEPVAIDSHPDVRRMLLAQKAYAEGALALCLFCANLVDLAPADPDAEALLALLTPVAKTWSSEFGLAVNDLAIQIHGGYGYTREFDVEQLYRDNRLNPIHEGTTGIQAIDLLGRKILRDDGRGLAVLRQRIARTMSAVPNDPELTGLATILASAVDDINSIIDGIRGHGDDVAMANATALLSAFGHVVVGWLWLDMALAASTGKKGDPQFVAGKRLAAEYFLTIEIPRVNAWLEPLRAGSTLYLRARPDCL